MKYLNVKEMQLKYIKINFIEVYRKFLHSLLIKFFFFKVSAYLWLIEIHLQSFLLLPANEIAER